MTEEDHRHRPVTIIINTRSHPWDAEHISYEQVVELAYPGQPITDQDSVTVRFSRGHDGHGSGTMTAGHHVKVKNGMVFDAYRTNRS
jgi:Multiubiquitin